MDIIRVRSKQFSLLLSELKKLTGLNILNQTTVLLELDNFVSGDKYIFFRDAYLQRRKYEISDGEIDADDFVDEFEDF